MQTSPITEERYKEIYPYIEFKKALEQFMKQATINRVTGRSNGSKNTLFSSGARLDNHYGQGAASKAPYVNYWWISIYWIYEKHELMLAVFTDTEDLVGAKSFPPHELSGSYSAVPGKGQVIEIFSCSDECFESDVINLYEKFMKACAAVDKYEIEYQPPNDRYLSFGRRIFLGKNYDMRTSYEVPQKAKVNNAQQYITVPTINHEAIASANRLDHVAKPASIYGCEYCDKLTQNKQYEGKLREYRTSDGKTIKWEDPFSGLHLSRTVDFFTNTGEVFRGDEISHSPRVHDAIKEVKNLIAFTVSSTRMKRYVLYQENNLATAIIDKLHSNNDSSYEDIVNVIKNSEANFIEISEALETLKSTQTPERVESLVSKIIRDPTIAKLVKEFNKYICEVCGKEPFIQSNGKLYAEADHIKPLGLGGFDSPDNMRCLCAQCHAIITHGSEKVIRELLVNSKWQY